MFSEKEFSIASTEGGPLGRKAGAGGWSGASACRGFHFTAPRKVSRGGKKEIIKVRSPPDVG